MERGVVGCRDRHRMLSEHRPEVADHVPQRRFAPEAHTSTEVVDRGRTRSQRAAVAASGRVDAVIDGAPR